MLQVDDQPSVAVLPVHVPVNPNMEVPLDPGSADYNAGSLAYADLVGTSSPSYGMQQIVITGHRLNIFDDYGSPFVSYNEYLALNGSFGEGGGGGGTGTTPTGGCVLGQKVDWHFIEEREGNSTSGKVPLGTDGHVLGHSGVTIASGFDLGSHNATDLKSLGFSSALVKTLTPYLGLKGQTAENYRIAHPLNITSADAVIINSASHSADLANLEVTYDTALGKTGAFDTLPFQAQTAIASLSFQYGDLASQAPKFWGDVVQKNWSAAISELRNFNDDHPTRRNLEADYMQNGVASGILNNGSLCGK